MVANNNSFCIDLPIYKNNKTFCGVTEVWKPRISNNAALAACIIPTIFAWFITLFIICRIRKLLFSIYKYNIQQATGAPAVNSKEKLQTKNLNPNLDEVLHDTPKSVNKEELHQIGSVQLVSDGSENNSSKIKGTVTDKDFLGKHKNRDKVDNAISKEHVMVITKVNIDASENTKDIEMKEMTDVSDKLLLEKDYEIDILKLKTADNMLAEKNIFGNDSSGTSIRKQKPTANVVSEQNSNHKRHWLYICIKKSYLIFTIVVLTNLKLLWDAIDVTIDAYLFYQLETGKVIHENIYRNVHVNNAILAFSVLGCLKILFWIRIMGSMMMMEAAGVLEDRRNVRLLSHQKLYFLGGTFIFEDGPELILEYFFVEKYMSKQLTWYLFASDIIFCAISLYTIVESSFFLQSGLSSRLRKSFYKGRYYKVKTCSSVFWYAIINSSSLLIGLLWFLRAGGAGYQYITGKLKRSCFVVKNGFLIQTPFTKGCLREVDYFIIALSGISLLCSIITIFVHNFKLKESYSKLSKKDKFPLEVLCYKFC